MNHDSSPFGEVISDPTDSELGKRREQFSNLCRRYKSTIEGFTNPQLSTLADFFGAISNYSFQLHDHESEQWLIAFATIDLKSIFDRYDLISKNHQLKDLKLYEPAETKWLCYFGQNLDSFTQADELESLRREAVSSAYVFARRFIDYNSRKEKLTKDQIHSIESSEKLQTSGVPQLGVEIHRVNSLSDEEIVQYAGAFLRNFNNGDEIEGLKSFTSHLVPIKQPDLFSVAGSGDCSRDFNDVNRTQEDSLLKKKGRLEYRKDFSQVALGGTFYNLSNRLKAKLCIQYLIEKEAYGRSSARHLRNEIDPFVIEKGGFNPSADIRLCHYFNDKTGQLQQLRKDLIKSAGRNGCYYLKVD